MSVRGGRDADSTPSPAEHETMEHTAEPESSVVL
jgi:hypothetical protein